VGYRLQPTEVWVINCWRRRAAAAPNMAATMWRTARPNLPAWRNARPDSTSSGLMETARCGLCATATCGWWACIWRD